MQGIRFDAKSAHEFLGGLCSWQISDSAVDIRGTVGMIQACSDLIVGQIEIEECFGPIDSSELMENIGLLSSRDHERIKREGFSTVAVYVIVFRRPFRYYSPVALQDYRDEITLLNAA